MKKKEFKALSESFLKTVITTIIAMAIAHGDIYSLNWKELISVGVIAGAGVIYSYFNPNDTRFGNKKPPTDKT